MIIANGYIELKSKTPAGIDPENGYPAEPVDTEWSEPIPCQYIAQKYTNLGRANGEHFIEASYQVLIEAQPFGSETVRLKDCDGETVGEFPVLRVEPLVAVDELRIWI
jgi:hypothetical protein